MAGHDLSIRLDLGASKFHRQIEKMNRDLAKFRERLEETQRKSQDNFAIIAKVVQGLRRQIHLLIEETEAGNRIRDAISAVGLFAPGGAPAALARATVAGIAAFTRKDAMDAIAAAGRAVVERVGEIFVLNERIANDIGVAKLANRPAGPETEALSRRARTGTFDLIDIREGVAGKLRQARMFNEGFLRDTPAIREVTRQLEALDNVLRQIASVSADLNLNQRIAAVLPTGGPTPDGDEVSDPKETRIGARRS